MTQMQAALRQLSDHGRRILIAGIAGWFMGLAEEAAVGAGGHYRGVSGIPLAGKISLFLLVAGSIAALGMAWLGQEIVLRKFGETESELVLRNRHILQQAIQADADSVGTNVLDWSQWNGLYDYAMGRNAKFASEELNAVGLDRLKLDAIQVISPDGRLISEIIRTGLTGPDGQLIPDIGNEIRLAVKPETRSVPASGWLNTSIGPLIVVARPILRSDATGPAAGVLIMARHLDPAALSAGVSVLPSQVFVHGSAYGPLKPDLLPLLAQLENSPDSAALVLRDTDMSDFRYFRDINGHLAFLLETRMPRTVLTTARETTHQLSIALLVFGAGIFLLLLVVIRFAVSRPLGQLAGHMQRLRETGEIRPAANADSGDEIGTLARSFNELLGAQQKASSELGMLSAAVRHADEAIVILEQDGCIAWVNPAYERSRNVKNADLLGCKPNDVVEGCDDPATYLAIWASARAGKTWKGRLRTVVGDGRVVTEDVVVSPVLHAGQTEPGGYVMLMHDVSEQIALEAQIAQTQRLEAVEQLAAGVAHEINTPAHYVDGNVRFLEEAFSALSGLLGKISDQACAAGDGALSAADISALLAEAVVDYLKTEVPVAIRQTLEGVGRISSIVQSMKELTDPAPDFVPANLNPIIEGAVIAARNEWADVAEFRMQLDPQLPWVPCQPEIINQVVVNMLVNAAQAIAGKGEAAPGHVVVSTCSAGDGVEISISDDGAGMAPSVQARIFDPFYTTRPVGEGTGQGLSTAHSVIRKHGGTIAVDSAPGRGSCFRIHLPLAEGQQASGGYQDPQLLRDTCRLAS